MSIDLNETILSLTTAAKSLPGRPHVSSIWRWCRRGVRGVQLETIVIAGRRFTSCEALQRFAEATTAAANGQRAPSRTNRGRQAEQRAAERECEEAGL
jgi:hypothetical protein